MIQSLSGKYKTYIAWPLFCIFYLQILVPISVGAKQICNLPLANQYMQNSMPIRVLPENKVIANKMSNEHVISNNKTKSCSEIKKEQILSGEVLNIGGPISPEASSFKAVGSNNLVNLANGSFSYSIPLLDVGGYPVNLFYASGIGIEQEASWVGLGWNINPGTVSRNMRGVPDDFNGTDLLIQTQNVKPNRTWGGDLGIDLEYVGIKNPKIGVGGSLGFSYNNYLGPALEIGTKVSLSLSTSQNVSSEKSAASGLGLTAALGAKLNSRSGLTFIPSLSASVPISEAKTTVGVGLSTSYNSRTGIKDISVHSEMSLYLDAEAAKDPKNNPNDLSTITSGKFASSIGSSTISFAKPSYIPSLRMPMENANYSGQIEFGGAIWGIKVGLSAMGYYSESIVPIESRLIKKPLVGYMYSEKAVNNRNAVMDFNRLNDAEVTPNTPIISAPQYNFDIFSIQGEGTGGSIRAYRGDLGFVRDNETTSKDKNISVGVDFGIPFHLGTNINIISTPTRVGGWEDGNNALKFTMSFKPKVANSAFENIYFKNPGEATVVNEGLLNRIGRDNLVRVKMGGSGVLPRFESQLEQFNKKTNTINGPLLSVANNNLQSREKRSQVITMLTATEASKIGLDTAIRNYTGDFDNNNNIVYENITRIDSVGFRKGHHISEIDVLEQNGMRYVYGLPVYSIKQKDFTFSVEGTGDANNMVNFAADEPTVDSRNMANKSKIDGYVQTQETPAYASSFLITGLLSPDYVDVKGDGITEDDLGSAVKFNYNKSSYTHKWRTPRNNTTANTAHLNEGIRTEKRDNKATISYGEREAWYLNSIESKSMVAIFKTDARDDAKGVNGEMDGRVNANENANKKLIRIDLYTKSEIKTKGITNARPIKTVNFEYDYSLCNGTPDNKNGNGKLTLKSVYFTYNGQLRQKKDRYVFNYGNTASQVDNPSYSYNASDRWGTYKPKIDPISSTANNPSGLSNIDFPYTLNDKSKCDKYASAWSLKKILLPSGGQMEMQYESGDYAYVQNRRACNMYSIYGLGKTTNYVNNSNMFNSGLSSIDNNYVYIKLLEPLVSTNSTDLKSEIFSKYLEDMTQPGGKKQLAFKLQVNYPKGPEPLTVYAEYDDYGLCSNAGSSKDYIFIHLKDVDGKSPLAKSAIGFLTENIPGQAFDGYNVEVDGLEAFITMAGGMLSSLKNAFRNVDEQMRNAPKGRSIDLAKSFIRLANPSKIKYGSGVRVKKIIVRDNWNKMSDQYNSVYGQEYDYKTTEKINGIEKSISSGVASYEPGIGSEENPFREIISFNNKMPLASAQYGAIEMPMLEGLYPSPNVVYSKVTVKSIHRKGTHGDSSLRSAIGKQVSEFYTAREFPSFSCYTPMDSKEYNKNPFFSFFYKEVINRRAITQGFLVETNDMHGKIKSQVAYSESDEKTALSASYHSYKNTGRNGLNDKVDFVYSNEGGTVRSGNIGVDMELMTDVREFSVMSKGFNGQLQVDLFTFAFAVIPLPTFFPLKTYVENKYRAVTCTKVINYHAIEDSVIVMDKGSVISTKTIAYDSETGAPIVSKTANEFNDPIYNTTYPSYWAYSGMGPAYKNVGVEYNNVTFYDGRITAGITDSSLFESGDELFIINGSGTSGCIGETPGTAKVWVLDKNKNSTALTVPVKDLVFIDQLGNMFTKSNVHFKIVRSGKRNNLGLTVSSVSSKKSPIQNISSEYRLVLDSTSKVVATSAVEYKEKWQTDNDAFLRRAYYADSCTGIETDSLSCNGILEKNINPYIKGLIGNYKPYRSYTYYGERKESNANSTTSIRNDGYISGYGNYWFFNNDNNLVPDVTNTKWVWNNELTKINTKGQELETKDALNRYTAAQYGYAKNMPVAMVQNSRYGESFYEGFEDYGYQENINSLSNTNCINKYINYSGIQNSSIINTDSITGSAHTGKTSLLVNANSEVVKTLQVDTSNYTNFNFEFPNENVSNFYLGPTGSHQKLTSTPYYPGAIYDFDYYNLGMSYEIKKNSVSGIPLFSYNSSANTSTFYSYYKTTQTIKITNAATHVFYLNAIQGDGSYWQTGCYFNRATIDLKIKDVTGQEVFATMLYSDAGQSVTDMFTSASKTDSTFLNCGIYTVECLVTADLGMNGYFTTLHTFISKCSYFSSPQVVTGSFTSCAHNVPIPAKDSMLNPINFKLIPEKRMQFSAWVKEDCSVPCYKTDYDKSKIEIKSNGNVIGNLKRSGAIIEGWQKIEGEFTIPYGSTSAQMVFTNTNNMPMFIDDIRIHPFNANMKSYVFDSRTLRLSAELDENNYSSIYEYDEEGQLVRVKKETIQGIKTIKETRSAKQKIITDLQ